MAFAVVYKKDTGDIVNVRAGVQTLDDLDLPTGLAALLLDNPPKTIGRDLKVVDGQLVQDEQYLLQEAKKNKKIEIENKYQNELSQPIEYNGNLFDADARSREIITSIIATAPDNFTTYWRTHDNQYVQVGIGDLKNIANMILDKGQVLFAKKSRLKDQVDAATTIEEVNAIQW